jgi:hypothetical protein
MSTALRTYYRGKNLVTMRDEVTATSRTYHFDHQGTTQCLTDGTGAVTDRFASDAWGVQVKRTGTSLNRHWYVGNWGYYRQLDIQSIYIRRRSYDWNRGRYLGRAHVGLGGAYVYAHNRPSSRYDLGRRSKGLSPSGRATRTSRLMVAPPSDCDFLRSGHERNSQNCDGDTGATSCNIDTGRATCFICSSQCGSECVERHELDGHLTTDARRCCALVHDCILAADGDAKREQECCRFYRRWNSAADPYQHRGAKAADLDCLNRLYNGKCCDKVLADPSASNEQLRCCISLRSLLNNTIPREDPPPGAAPACPPIWEWPQYGWESDLLPPTVPFPKPSACVHPGKVT